MGIYGDKWTGRGEVLNENGTVTHSVVRIIPKCPIVLSKSGEYFKPSTTSMWLFMERVCRSILTQHFNSEEMFPDSYIKASLVSKSSGRYLLEWMRKCLFDCCSAKKRAGMDSFFESTEHYRYCPSFKIDGGLNSF